ncbi:uncharacterized protein A4U43_C01F25890 [Asparagus officinalis]|uniref:Uncharacterized protein n=1 Tax=Asparagus officinalis TaxID=4686 RepID=A0A5P1FUQ6_ASPOF|nr:uncharacterized protein A4U43_C01F25890 [Asparagus officinalis]
MEVTLACKAEVNYLMQQFSSELKTYPNIFTYLSQVNNYLDALNEVERLGGGLPLVAEEENREDEAGFGGQSEEGSDDYCEVSWSPNEDHDLSPKSDTPLIFELACIVGTSKAFPGSIPTLPLNPALVLDPSSVPGASQ